MKKLFLCIFAGIVALTGFAAIAQADTLPVPPQVFVKDITLDKTTYSAGSIVTGSFALENGTLGTNISGIMYHVSLTGDYNSNGLAGLYYDTKIYGPVFLTGSDTHKIIHFSYVLPKTFGGTGLGIQVRAYLATGDPLGWSDAFITVTGALSHASITDESLIVDTAQTSIPQRFTVLSGPTIYKNAHGALAVAISNTSKDSLSLVPHIVIYDRSVSGKILDVYNATSSVILASGGSRNLSFSLPTFDYQAGVYFGELNFLDAQGMARTVPVQFRYIIAGDILSISSITSPVSAVTKGDILNLTVTYAGAPYDIFTGETPGTTTADLAVNVYNEKDQLVGTYTERSMDFNSGASKILPVPIYKNAQALRVVATVTSGSKMITSYTADLSANYEEMHSQPGISENLFGLIAIVVAALIIIGLTIFFFMKKKGKYMLMTLLIMVGVGCIGYRPATAFTVTGTHFINVVWDYVTTGIWQPANSTDPYADGYEPFANNNPSYTLPWLHYASSGTGDPSEVPTVLINYPTDSDTLQPNQSFYITGSTYAAACENNPQDILVTITFNGETRTESFGDVNSYNGDHDVVNSPVTDFSVGPFTAPASGTSQAVIRVDNYTNVPGQSSNEKARIAFEKNTGLKPPTTSGATEGIDTTGGDTEGVQNIVVASSVPTVSLTASPSSVTSGGSSILTWTTTNSPTSCTASGDWTGSKTATGGTQSMSNLTTTKNYTITCTNSAGSGNDTATVTVTSPNIPVVSFSSNVTSYTTGGGNPLFTWSATNSPTSCTATGGTSSWDAVTATSGTSQQFGPISQTTTYTLACTNAGGVSAPVSITINVSDASQYWLATWINCNGPNSGNPNDTGQCYIKQTGSSAPSAVPNYDYVLQCQAGNDFIWDINGAYSCVSDTREYSISFSQISSQQASQYVECAPDMCSVASGPAVPPTVTLASQDPNLLPIDDGSVDSIHFTLDNGGDPNTTCVMNNSGGDRYWDNWSGVYSNNVDQYISTDTLYTTTTYTVTCWNSVGSDSASTVVTVKPPTVPYTPPTATITANPQNVAYNGTVTLSGTVNAGGDPDLYCEIIDANYMWRAYGYGMDDYLSTYDNPPDLIGPDANGAYTYSQTITPYDDWGNSRSSIQYEITCTNSVGRISATTTVTTYIPPVVTLSANPTNFVGSGNPTLTWTVDDGGDPNTTCAGSGGWQGSVNAAGGTWTLPNTITQATTYTLICTNGAGDSNTATATVTIGNPPNISLAANPSSAEVGSYSQLNWTLNDQDESISDCILSNDANDYTTDFAYYPYEYGSYDDTTGNWVYYDGSQESYLLTSTVTYTLTCINPYGSDSATATITVAPPTLPSVSLSADPALIYSNDTSDLSWNIDNGNDSATYCYLTDDQDNFYTTIEYYGYQYTTSPYTTPPLSATTEYTITCTNSVGTVSGSATVTVNPQTDPPYVTLTADPNPVSAGDTSTISWSATNEPTSCTAWGDWQGQGMPAAGSWTTGPLTTTTTYSLSCSNGAGISNTATVQVPLLSNQPAVTLVSDEDPNNPISSGQSANLSWTIDNKGDPDTSCNLIDDYNSFNQQIEPPATPTGTMSTGYLTADTTFTLTCTNKYGTASADTTVTVNQTCVPAVGVTADNSVTVLAPPQRILTWSSNCMNSCSSADFTVPIDLTTGLGQTSGSTFVPVPSISESPKKYTVMCTPLTGSSESGFAYVYHNNDTLPTCYPKQYGLAVTSAIIKTPITWISANIDSSDTVTGWQGDNGCNSDTCTYSQVGLVHMSMIVSSSTPTVVNGVSTDPSMTIECQPTPLNIKPIPVIKEF